MNKNIIDGKDTQEIKEQILERLRDIALADVNLGVENAVIVSGDALLKITANEDIKEKFFDLTEFS